MAKGIVVSLSGEVSEFGITRVDREKLYGRKVRTIVDEAGKPAQAALLTSDGSALVPPGGTASLYVDEAFDCVERSELKAISADGKPVAPVPSTLGVEQPLAEVSPQVVLDHVVTAVYQLSPATLGEKLKAALAAGKIFQTRFNYRDDFDDAAAFLLQNEAGPFALVAQPTDFAFVERDAPTLTPDDESDEGGELDFNMM